MGGTLPRKVSHREPDWWIVSWKYPGKCIRASGQKFVVWQGGFQPILAEGHWRPGVKKRTLNDVMDLSWDSRGKGQAYPKPTKPDPIQASWQIRVSRQAPDTNLKANACGFPTRTPILEGICIRAFGQQLVSGHPGKIIYPGSQAEQPSQAV